jgi:hypothetical protein
VVVIVAVPLLVFLVPLCLVIAFRNTRGWWVPGAATFAVGLVMCIISATQKPSHGGDLPLISGAELIGVLGLFLTICGVICSVIGAWLSRAGREAWRSGDESAAELSPAYVVDRRRACDRPRT